MLAGSQMAYWSPEGLPLGLNAMLGIRVGRRGHTHADITIALSPILDLAEKLKATMGAPPNE